MTDTFTDTDIQCVTKAIRKQHDKAQDIRHTDMRAAITRFLKADPDLTPAPASITPKECRQLAFWVFVGVFGGCWLLEVLT